MRNSTSNSRKPLTSSRLFVLVFLLVGISAGFGLVNLAKKLQQVEPAQAQVITPSVGVPSAQNLERIFVVNIPSFFKELVTMTALTVEGESIFGGEVTFENEVVFDGQLTLTSDVFADGINIDLGSGEITASNVIYSLEEGAGISISDGQNPTISATDVGSGQNIFKKIKVGSDTAEADENSDTLEFAAGSGISVSVDTGSDKITITNSALPGFVKSGTYALLADGVTSVGVGTSTPSNTFELNSGTNGESGFSFTQLTSSSTAGVGGGKVLSVDSGGRMILVVDQTGEATPSAEAILPSATNGMTLYYNGTNWVASDNLFHDGGSVGISNAAPTSRFQVNTNLASKIGVIVQGYTSQAANLQEWRDSTNTILSYIDSNGVFNGSANVSGSLNPGLTTGSVLFQGPYGIAQDNSNFFWDDTNKRLGIGSGGTVPDPLSVFGASQLLSTGRGQIGAYSTDAQGTDLGGQLVLGGQDGSGRRSFAAIAGRKENATSGDRSGYLQLSTRATGPGTTDLTERMRITSGGLVGIGTTVPISPLHVDGGYGANALATFNQLNSGDILTASASGTMRMILTNAGVLRLGTGGTLGTFADPIVQLGGTSNGFYIDGSRVVIKGQGVATAVFDNTGIRGNGGATMNILTQATATDTAPVFLPNVGASTTGIGGTSGTLSFITGGSSRLKIDSLGNIGIGTTSPVHKLHVTGNYAGNALVAFNETGGQDILTASGSGTTRLRLTNAGNMALGTGAMVAPVTELTVLATSTPRITFGNTTRTPSSSFNYVGLSSNGQQMVYNGGFNQQAGYGHVFVADSSSVEIMRMEATGNVGIGTTAPTSKFHVNGVYGGNALMTLNDTSGANNIFTASASGTTRFTIANNGGTSIVSDSSSALTVINQSSNTVFRVGGSSATVSIGTSATGVAKLFINNTTSTEQALVIRAAASQTSNLTAWQDSSSNVLARVNQVGQFFAPYGEFVTTSSSLPGLLVRGISNQSAPIFRVQNSASADQLVVDFNNNVGIGLTNPIHKLHVTGNYAGNALVAFNETGGQDILTASASGTTRLILSNAGNLGLGTAAPSYQLDVISTSSGANMFRAVRSGTSRGLTITSDGYATFTDADATSANHLTVNSTLVRTTSSGLQAVAVNMTSNITQTSGSDRSTALYIQGTVNQTGGGTGITAGLRINPTLTSAADYRAIELNNASGFGVYQSGASALNYFAGKVGIGAPTAAQMLDVLAASGTNIAQFGNTNGVLRIENGATYNALTSYSAALGGYRNMKLETGSSGQGLFVNTSGNVGIGTTTFGTSAVNALAIAGSTAPTTSITDGVQLFAVDVAGSHELQVRDEAGNTTTLSPHNFSVIGDKSEELAWSFYSERNSLAINADMTKALRVVEKLSGEKLVYLKDLATGQLLEDESDATKVTELADNGSIGEVARWNYQLWTFIGEVIFEKPVQFLAQVTFNGKAVFAGATSFDQRVTFADEDMAGFATITPGNTKVTVSFKTGFAQTPVVTVAPKSAVKLDWFRVTEESSNSFVIEIAGAQAEEVVFSWTALAVEQAGSVVTSPATTQPQASLTPAPTAQPATSPVPTPSPTIEPTPISTSSAETATSSATTP